MLPREWALALVVVLVWGGSFTVIKLGLHDIPPMLLGALRYLLSAFPALLWFARPKVPWRWWLAYGLTVGVGQFAFLFWAVRLGLPAGVASVALQMQAFFTAFFAAMFLGEPLRARACAGLLLAMMGLGLLVQPALQAGGAISPWAYPLVLAAAASWGASNIVLRKAAQSVADFDLMAFIVWTSLVPPLPFVLLSLAVGERVEWHGVWPHLTGVAWLAVGYLAIGGTLLGNGLFSQLLTKYPAGRIASLTLLVPVAGLSIATLVAGETLTGQQGFACGLVCMALVITMWPGSTTTACSNPLATSRRPRLRQTTTGNSPIRTPSRPDLNQPASTEPGAVHSAPACAVIVRDATPPGADLNVGVRL